MPKMKTNRAAAKRYRRTGNGKLRHQRSGRRHLLTKKTRKRIRRLRKPALVAGGDTRLVRKLVPYL